MAIGQAFVVEAEQMNRGVQVVKVDFSFHGIEAEIVGFTVGEAAEERRRLPSRAQKLSGWCSRPCFSMGNPLLASGSTGFVQIRRTK